MRAAEAHLALQDASRALAHCESGLALIRRGGLVRDVVAALNFAARLTGELRFEAEARAQIEQRLAVRRRETRAAVSCASMPFAACSYSSAQRGTMLQNAVPDQ